MACCHPEAVGLGQAFNKPWASSQPRACELQAKASTCTAVPRSGRALLQGSPLAPVRSSNNHRSPGSPWAAMDLMELAPHLTTINRMSPGSEARTILYLIFLIFFYLYIYLYIYKSTTVLPLQRERFFFFLFFIVRLSRTENKYMKSYETNRETPNRTPLWPTNRHCSLCLS